MTVDEPSAQRDGPSPNAGNYDGGNAADWPLLGRRRQVAMFSHDRRRNQPDDKQDSQRDQDYVVQIAQHRDEIWNEIDWRKGIASDDDRYRFRIPRYAGIAAREVKCMHVALDSARPAFQTVSHWPRHLRSRQEGAFKLRHYRTALQRVIACRRVRLRQRHLG